MGKRGRAAPDESLVYWTEALTGLAPDRVARAREELAGWGLERVSEELLEDSVDGAVAATLLVEAIEELDSRGVPRARSLKKLRKEPAVWSTWAEIRAAKNLLTWAGEGAELRLEEGRSKGAHADFRILLEDDPVATSVEIKSVGLSDEEVAFCERMSPHLGRLTPREGLTHTHAPIDGKPPQLTRGERLAGQREARKSARQVPGYPRGLRGAAIVGHGSEDSYVGRVSRRVAQAVRQLPDTDACWVGLLWSNGAPVRAVAQAIRWDEIPPHVVGIILLGSGVAFPHREIHVFILPVARDTPPDAERELRTLDETEGMERIATLVLDRFERSSGVRATLLYGGGREILRREGARRILPFNLLLDADPEGFDRETPEFWRRVGKLDTQGA